MKKILHLTVVLLCAILSGAIAQAPSILDIQQSSWTKIVQAPTTTWGHYPRGISFEVPAGAGMERKIIINWQVNKDVVMFPMDHAWAGSVNEGITFNSPSQTYTLNINDMDMMGLIRKNYNNNSDLLAIPFYLGYDGTRPNPPFLFSYYTSDNTGTSWTKHLDGSVDGFPAGQQIAGFRFHRGIIQDAGGTMYAPAHGQWRKPDGSWDAHRVMLMKSVTGGATWTWVSNIQTTAGESSIVRCKDGSMLAVMRVPSNSLIYRRSLDNGVNWSAAATLPNVPANHGVDPLLELLPNGILVLSYGSNIPADNMRHCLVTFSPDGNGYNWISTRQTYTSVDSPGTYGNKSSGYTTAFPLRNNRFMQLSDRALYTYYGAVQHPNPNPFSIWSKTLDLVLNYRNRIDLKTRYIIDPTIVSTDMTASNAAHPEARISGAFDANTDYWNGAYKDAGSGFYTIDLKQNQTINGMSICLLRGRAQGATIQHSLDGTTWTTFMTYPGTTVHHTVDYTSFAPFTARYVKVNVTSTSAMVGLNEINLFNVADTFEDYALNVKPYGYTMLNTGFWVSEGVTPLPTGHQSQRALYMYDTDGTNKELSKTDYTASDAQVMEFKLKIKGFASGGCVQFCLKSGTTSVFRIAVFPVTGTNNGTIKYNNGTWNALLSGTNVLIPKDAWRSVKVVADAPGNVAAIYIDGTFAGYATKQTAGATTMDGIMFASGGSGAIGDEALFDDVVLYPYGTIPGSAQAASSSIPVKSNLADKNLDQLNSFGIRLSPNPAGSTMGLTVSNAEQGKLYVQVVNISGTVVKKVEFTVTGSTDKYEMPIADLAQGMYIVQVTQGKNTLRAKLIKQ